MIANKFNWAGEFIFNGLAIVWVAYTKGGVEGAVGESDEDESGFSFTKKPSIGTKKESSDKVDLFKKRALFANDDAGSVNV